jgi:hypothetical protein
MRQRQEGCTAIYSFSKHWTCLLPQMGPGMKHERVIALEHWQQGIVDEFPGLFLRGLFHSDGCRTTNRIRRRFKSGERRYEYPRYFFSNRSTDIMLLMQQTLEDAGIEWRMNNPWSLSVAKRASVAMLDELVGPKY